MLTRPTPTIIELMDFLISRSIVVFGVLVAVTCLLCYTRHRHPARPGIVEISLHTMLPGTAVIVGMLWGLAWLVGM